MFPFGMFHRPLKIPLTSIASCERKSSFLIKTTEVTLVDHPAVIRFMGLSGEALFRTWESWRRGARRE
jgi:hypothetical protein